MVSHGERKDKQQRLAYLFILYWSGLVEATWIVKANPDRASWFRGLWDAVHIVVVGRTMEVRFCPMRLRPAAALTIFRPDYVRYREYLFPDA